MEKPLASAILHSLLFSLPSLTTTSTIAAAVHVMHKPTRSPLLPHNFFSPRPRRRSGKERAHETVDDDVALQLLGICRDWSCAIRHPVWCSKRARLLMMNELIPRRVRVRRTDLSQHPPHSASPRTYASHISFQPSAQKRHASNISETSGVPPKPPEPSQQELAEPPESLQADAPPIESAEHDGLPNDSSAEEDATKIGKGMEDTIIPLHTSAENTPSDPVFSPGVSTPPKHDTPSPITENARLLAKEGAVREFRSLAGRALPGFSLEDAWAASASVVRERATSDIPIDVYLDFTEKIIGATEMHYLPNRDIMKLHLWGRRARGLLEGLAPNLSPFSHPDSRRKCLLARTYALSGEVERATSVLHDLLSSNLLQEKYTALPLEAYSKIFLSIWTNLGAAKVFDFVASEWMYLGPHMYSETDKFGSRTLVQTLQAILDRTDDPAAFIDSRVGLDTDTTLRIGEILVRLLCDMNFGRRAHQIVQSIRKQQLVVPVDLVLRCVRALVRIKAFRDANVLWKTIPEGRFAFYRSTAIYLAAMQGEYLKAERYFDMRLPGSGDVRPRPKDKAMLLVAYTKSGQTARAVEVFEEFFPHNPTTGFRDNFPVGLHYSVIVSAFATTNNFESMNKWLEEMTTQGIKPNPYLFNHILQTFALRSDMESMSTVLTKMREAKVAPNVVTYTMIMTLLAHKKDPVGAEVIFKRAVKEGIVPDRKMVNTLMDAHLEAGSWQGVIQIFDYLHSSPVKSLALGIDAYNILLKAYVFIGAPFRVVSRLFEQLVTVGMTPDDYTYVALVQSACDAGLMDVALNILDELDVIEQKRQASDSDDSTQSQNLITVYILTTVMAGFLRLNQKARAKAVYDDMRTRGIQPNSVTFGAIIKAYGNTKTDANFAIAEAYIKELMTGDLGSEMWTRPSHGLVTPLENVYGPMVTAYAHAERPEDVERIFQDYLDSGGQPSLHILCTILDAYRRIGAVDAVKEIWPQIFALAIKVTDPGELFESANTSGLRLNANILCVSLSIYIDALSAAGLHAEIPVVWKEVQEARFTFDSHNWNHLILAMIRAGQPERAFEVVEKVIHPYRVKSERMWSGRDKTPTSPVFFDVREDRSMDTPVEPSLVEAAGNRTSRRVEQVKVNTVNIGRSMDYDDDEERALDFAHPLHIMHTISPSWSTWKVHGIVLSELNRVLNTLRVGRLVHPVVPGQSIEPRSDPSSAEEASQMLSRIWRSYPIAVRMAEEQGIKEQTREERNR